MGSKEYGKEYRLANREKIKEYSRQYYLANKDKCKESSRIWSQNNPDKVRYKSIKYRLTNNEKTKGYRNKWNEINPEKRKAHTILYNTIKAGKIDRQPCSVCGSTENIQGHHEDYSKPLEVIWLCPKHHKQLHTSRILASVLVP